MASTRRIAVLEAAATLALVGAPLYWLQGRRVRRRTQRLEEAPGERAGALPGSPPNRRIVGLGESPMAAVGLDDQGAGVIPRLASLLAESSGRRVEWRTSARSGATARFTREVLLPRIEPGGVDRVIVALGVNDCLALRSSKRWLDELERLTSAIRERLEPGGIIFTGVPPMRHFPALPIPLATMLGLRARLLDASLARFTRTDASLVHAPMDFAQHPDGMFCRDGFHPNEAAHRLWAGQLAELVSE
ncbi:MAG: SGNH/GDSL hydrolase family protein [Gammaproteobacteria bacterium]|nr:SGNH/GDSL hydrolase family protein [Gammaproteobacteria bacterium]